MAATAENVKEVQAANHNKAMIRGRIEHVQQANNGRFYTEVLLPAADEFSKPASVKIESRASLGVPGDTITQLCQFEGFTRTFATKEDQARGNGQRSGRDINTWLIAVGK